MGCNEMPTRSKMTDEEIEEIQRLIAEGLGDGAIAAQVGRHRTSVVKVRTGGRRRSVTTGGKQLQVRLTDEEYEAFNAEVDRLGITLSEGGRRLVRHSLGILDVAPAEIDAVVDLRRELNAIGVDLNRMVKLANSGPVDIGEVEKNFLSKLDLKVDDVVNQLIAFVGAGRRKTFVRAVFPLEGPISE